MPITDDPFKNKGKKVSCLSAVNIHCTFCLRQKDDSYILFNVILPSSEEVVECSTGATILVKAFR